jgi:prephenate dehydrogenase
MRVAILGLGLIGGSIARALATRRSNWPVRAWSPTGRGPAAAASSGEAHAATTAGDAIVGADLVVLAAPPLACLDLLDELAGSLRNSLGARAVVTDVASTKRRLVARASELGLPFVGGHPMAGREAAGYDAADPDLFVDRPWIVTTDGATRDGIERVEELATAVGARPTRMDAATHDAAAATISHLPLVLAAALASAAGRDPDGRWKDERRLAAGGWESMTRLARGDVEMGAGILATNADNVAVRLRAIRRELDAWLEQLEGSADQAEIRTLLADARDILEPDR